MADHIFARNPQLAAALAEVFQRKISDGHTPEAAMLAVLDRALSLYDQSLAAGVRPTTEGQLAPASST